MCRGSMASESQLLGEVWLLFLTPCLCSFLGICEIGCWIRLNFDLLQQGSLYQPQLGVELPHTEPVCFFVPLAGNNQ